MSLYRDIERGGRLEVDLATNHKLRIMDKDQTRKVVVQLIYKRGHKFARLAIDAPDDVSVEVFPPDGVIFPVEGL
jgi:hypothetical protein